MEHDARRIARRLSMVAIVAFAAVLFRFGLPVPYSALPWYETATLAALTMVAIGLALAWRWEGLGGSIALLGGVAAGVVGAVQYHPLVALGMALLFAGPSVLFLIAWHRTRSLASIVALAVVLAAVMAAGGVVALDVYEAGFGPAHPQSDTPPTWATPVVWAWSGGVTARDAVVVADVRTSSSPDLVVTAATGEEMVVAGSAAGSIVRFDIAGLTPGTDYQYSFRLDGAKVGGGAGSFSTFAEGPTSFTVAIGGCSRLHSNGVVYDAIREVEPDLFLSLGDLFYADIQSDSPAAFSYAYESTLTQPAQAALYASMPIAYVWDDHDFGPNDADASALAAPAAQAAFREIVPHHPFAVEGDRAPIAQAFTIGRVRFILTDGRSHRDPAAGTMLGAEQLAWLQAELLDASRSHALVVLGTNVPWVAGTEPGADHWGGYADERAVIARFIADNDVDNLVMLAGDAHMVAIDDGTNSNYSSEPGPAFPVMHAAALDRPGSEKGGPYSEGAFPGGGQYGLLTVADDGAVVTVRLSGHTWDGVELTALEVQFGAGP